VVKDYRKKQIVKMLRKHKRLSKQGLADKFDCSTRTIRRDMNELDDEGTLPNFYDEKLKVYRLDASHYIEVEGLWFSPEELYALLLIQQLTEKLAGGAFDMRPLHDKIEKMLGKMAPDKKELSRFRVFYVGSRAKNMPHFGTIAKALMARKRLQIKYHGREKDIVSERMISPQRMVFYKGNWYMDAWCHRAKGLRSFAIEQVVEVSEGSLSCRNISEKTLNVHYTQTFGIFSGEPIHTAVLVFSKKASLWVQDEEWFPDNHGRYLEDGRFQLKIPYNNSTELIMEICRYGAEVEVIEPPELRESVKQLLQKAADQYC